MAPSTTPSEPSPVAQWAVLLAAPLICSVVGALSLPSPRPVEEERKTVDRSELKSIVSNSPPASSDRLGAELGGKLRLVSAEIPTQALAKGDTFELKTHWKVLKALDRKWQMFVHIDLRGGRHRIHGDHMPTGDKYPTDLWRPGEVVTDAWKHRIPLDSPPGTYDIFLGFYIGDERMPFSGGNRKVHAGENRLRIGTLQVQ